MSLRLHAALAAALLLLPAGWLHGQVSISGDVSPSPASSPNWNVGGILTVGQTYTLIGFGSSTFSVAAFGFTNTGGFAGNFALNADNLNFTLTAIPEPSTLALLAFNLLALRWCQSRRMLSEKH